MTADSVAHDEQLKNSFQKVLDQHGYGFQYGVLKIASELPQKGSRWYFEASEFPVQVQGSNTKIDFILRRGGEPSFYLLAECKRANPALSNWCFVRAPYVHRKHFTDNLLLEHYERRGYHTPSMVKSVPVRWDTYHISVEVRSVKSDNKGDANDKGRGAIEDASTQVCRGLNGMIEFWASRPNATGNQMQAVFLPVIFTTAQIWVSDANLGSTELETGKINFDHAQFVKKDWIIYQYHMTPNLKHAYTDSQQAYKTIGEFMEAEYIRSVAIVNPTGIVDFLLTSSVLDFDY